jgi:hypothetical protein
VSDLDTLADDLLGIYARSGREVTYVSDRGETRPYWPNRFLQALKRAIAEGDSAVLDFTVRLVAQPEPSRGFEYLRLAGRLDISVEALVADPSRPYHHRFPPAAVSAARARLSEHGYAVREHESASQSRSPSTAPTGSEPAVRAAATPVNASWGATLKLGDRMMTLTGHWWYLMAIAGLRPDQVAELNEAVLNVCGRHNAPLIGGNHVLEALLETELYQRIWPGAEAPTI